MTYSDKSYSRKRASLVTIASRAGRYADSLEYNAALMPTAYRSSVQLAREKLKKVINVTGGVLPQSLAEESPGLIELWENLMFEKYGSFRASHADYLSAQEAADVLIAQASGRLKE